MFQINKTPEEEWTQKWSMQVILSLSIKSEACDREGMQAGVRRIIL